MSLERLKKRDSYFDFLRGVAIIFVIGIHTVSTNLDFSSIEGISVIVIRQLIGCAVPIFLAISGYFISKKSVCNLKDYTSFLKHQIPIVYLPCLFWSIPYLLLSIKDGTPILNSIILFLLCGMSIYYFINSIIQCYVLSPIAKKANVLVLVLLLLISVIWSYMHVKYNLISRAGLPLIVYAAPFPNLFVFFVLGCWLGIKERNYSFYMALVCCLLSLGLCVYETYYHYENSNLVILGMKVSSHIFDFFAVLLLFHKKTKDLYKENIITVFISRLGISSFTIYLCHMLIAIFLFKVNFLNSSWLLKWFSLLIATSIFVYMLKLILPCRFWKFIGLR